MIKISGSVFEDLDAALAFVDQDNENEAIIDLDGEVIHRQLKIDKPHVTLKNGTLECDLGAYEILEDGYKRGTFRSYSVYIDADHVRFEDLKVLNTSGYESGQAIALMIDGDEFSAENCTISSYQDTLFLAPLPESEYEKRGFIGPLMDKERKYRHAYFEKCLIEGSVDFIFGGGMGYFRDCEIRSRNIHKEINGYVCAPNTPEDREYGFIFDACRFTSEEGMEDSVYLARPWRDHGKCLIIDSDIGPHIRAEGYHDWDKPHARITSEFKEYGNRNQNIENRTEWMKQVTEKDLSYIQELRKKEKR